MDDPLGFIDFADILRHGDPGPWRPRGPKPGSPVPANSRAAAPGTMKHFALYEDEFGDLIEVHYFRHTDGSVGDVKIKE